MESRHLNAFDPLTMLMSVNDDVVWKEQVSAAIVYLTHMVDQLREENADLKRQIGAHPKRCQTNTDEKLSFDATHVKPRFIKGFDPLNPNRVQAIGTIVVDFANAHGLNGYELTQIVQPLTTGVIRKLFDSNADQYTYTEDSIGKGRPARYAKVPTEFIKELSEAICDGFNPNRMQRAQILSQARTMAGTVARNYFNNARSHRKKITSTTPSSQQTDSPSPMELPACTNALQLFETRGFRPVFLPYHPPAAYFHQINANGPMQPGLNIKRLSEVSGVDEREIRAKEQNMEE